MVRPRGSTKAKNGRRTENLAALSTEVLRLRLQALNLPITGSKKDLIARLTALKKTPHAGNAPPAGRVDKKRQGSKRASRPCPAAATSTTHDEDSLDVSSVESSSDELDAFDEPADLNVIPGDEATRSGQHPGPFTAEQLSAIQETVLLSVEQAFQQRAFDSIRPNVLSESSITSPQPRRPGTATPIGLQRPLENTLEDKILRGEYIDSRFSNIWDLGTPVPKSLVIWVSPVGIPKTLTGNKIASHVGLLRTKSLLEEVSKIFVRS